MIRNIEERDLAELKKIHAKYFASEFSFDDFMHGAISSFVITDDSDNTIITSGCIRPIAEMVAITNLEKSPRLRRAALFDMLQIASYVLRSTNMNQLHAFVQDSKWETQLIRAGFKRCVGKPVYIDL